jgi:hypothetical protein
MMGSLLLGNSSQKVSRFEDWNASKRMKHEQVLIAAHDNIRTTCDRNFQELVVVGIAAGPERAADHNTYC